MFRSTPGGRACVVTAGWGMRSDFCALATLPRSVSSRPASPAAAPMPAVAAPAARKLRRGGPSGSSVAGSARGAGRPRQGDQQLEHCYRGGGRGQGGQQARDRGVRPGRRGGQPDRREHRDAGHAVGHPPDGRRADQGRERAQHDHDPGDQDELVVRAELGDGEVLQPRRREVDLQLADHHHRRSAGPGQPGHELPHAQRRARGQHPRDGAESRAPRVRAPSPLKVMMSIRRGRRPGLVARPRFAANPRTRRCYEYQV